MLFCSYGNKIMGHRALDKLKLVLKFQMVYSQSKTLRNKNAHLYIYPYQNESLKKQIWHLAS